MVPGLQIKDASLSLEMEAKSHCQISLSDLLYFSLFFKGLFAHLKLQSVNTF